MKKILCMLLLLLAFASTALARNITVTGYGMTEAEAINDAKRAAIEQAVGSLVDSQTIVENNTLLRDEVYSISHGFVNRYDVVAKQQHPDGWHVCINAEVDTNPDSKLLDLLQRLKLIDVTLRSPKIAVVITNASDKNNLSAENGVTKAFLEAGFDDMIDISQERFRLNNPFNLDEGGLKNLASSMQADLLVVGKATSENVGDVGKFLPGYQQTNMLSSRAIVEAKLYIARTGQIIAADAQSASAVDISREIAGKKALANAGHQTGEYLANEYLKSGTTNRQKIELVVLYSNYTKVQDLQRALAGVRGVNNPQTKDARNGRAVLTMNYNSSPETLYNHLAELMEGRIQMQSASYNVLTVEIW